MQVKEIINKRNAELSSKYKYKKETWISVSNIKDALKTPFDDVGIATKTYERHFDNPSSKYYQMTVDDILALWKSKGEHSRTCGTLIDEFIERFVADNDYDGFAKKSSTGKFDDMERRFLGAKTCLTDMNGRDFIFDCREMKLILPFEYKGVTYVINGRLDALFRRANNDNKVLIDWKTSEDIPDYNSYDKKLLGPCSHLDECDGNLFALQLYIYKYILTHVYKIEGNIIPFIVQFPANKEYLYKFIEPAFEYNEELLENIFEFVIEKRLQS